MSKAVPVMIVHGGAWAIPEKMVTDTSSGVCRAVQAGYRVLQQQGTSLDAVEAAVKLMEDDPIFNSGYGSLLTERGEVEMDAVMMRGSDLKAGAVASVHNIQNPVSLARKVLEKTDYCLLVGTGADAFAREQQTPIVSSESLISDYAKEELQMYLQNKDAFKATFNPRELGHDTVGAVAIDVYGNIACATSTGGITAQHQGRVGDSPIVGCGCYCDDEVGGVSCCGHGEAIMRVCLAHHIINLMKQGLSPAVAAEKAVLYMSERVKSTGGAIVLDKQGRVGMYFSTEKMAWAWVKYDTMHHGMLPGDENVTHI